MTQKEMLIKSLLEIYKDDTAPLVFYFTEEEAEFVADCLIKSGIVFPPCKAGDTIYMPWIWNGEKGIASLEVTRVVLNKADSYVKTYIDTDDEAFSEAYNNGKFAFEDFGQMVFLAYEEAKKTFADRLMESAVDKPYSSKEAMNTTTDCEAGRI